MYKHHYAMRLAAALIATALFAAPALAAASADDTVIAVVNGDKIYKKDVMKAIDALPLAPGADKKRIFGAVVDQIVNEKLIDEAANAANVEQSDDFKKRLDLIKPQLAKQIYLEHLVKDKVSDNEVKGEYNKFRDDNKGKEEVHARHILVKTEDEAKQVIRDLKDGAKFEDLVKQRSSDTVTAREGGDLGWFRKEDFLPEFSDAAFKLKIGETSKEPVQTKFGWHVIKVEDRHLLQVPKFEDVQTAIREKLAEKAVKDVIDGLREKAEIKLFDINGKPMIFGEKKAGGNSDAPDKSAKDDKAAPDKTAKDQPDGGSKTE